MSYQQAVARVEEIMNTATPRPKPQPSGNFAAEMNKQIGEMNSAPTTVAGSAAGIPRAAYSAAEPVQQGRLREYLFKPRLTAARIIASRFGLQVSSGYRTPQHNAEVGGVPNSLHTRGLGFDFTGSMAQMNKAKAFAESHPEVFQEVLLHDAGSGLHLHLGFRSG